MENDRKNAGKIPANDNRRDKEAKDGEDIAPPQRLDRVVLDIARLIGRQMAREEFERRLAANDNRPRSSGNDEGGADED